MSKTPFSEEEMGPLERGRGRYHRKDYSGALVAFTQAVSDSTGQLLLSALDHRAAAHEKLEQLQLALRDAKQMIDLKPDLSKGYLRCGKVLQLKGENVLALKIYERGLKKVKIGTDDQRMILQTMFNKLRQAQDPGRTLDPLEFLPLELAELVCQNLTIRDRVICLAVSKGWKRLLESSHKLWTTLDTTPTRKGINKNSLRAHLKRSNYTLDHAIITMKASFDAHKMGYLIRTCKKLKILEIRGIGLIGDSLTSALPDAHSLETIFVSNRCEIGLKSVQEALRTCHKTLVQASFLCVKGFRGVWPAGGVWPQLDSLKTIHLKSDADSFLDLHGLRDATPNIKVAILNGWTPLQPAVDIKTWDALEHLDLSNSHLVSMPTLPPTLKHLILENNPHLEIRLDEDDPFELPLLETLNIFGTFITTQVLKAMTVDSIKNGNLKTLNVGGRPNDHRSIPPADEFPSSETVEKLSLANLIIGDKQTMGIVDLYPNLRSLDVSWTKITGVAVKHFVNIGIIWLKLDECSSISTDAIEWARRKGVEVEFNFPSRSSGRPSAYREALAGAF